MRIAVAKSDSRDASKECLNSAMIKLEMSPYLNLKDSVCRAKGVRYKFSKQRICRIMLFGELLSKMITNH